MRRVVYTGTETFSAWVAREIQRGSPYDDTARTVTYVEEKDGNYEVLACVVFNQWNTLGHAEASIASNGSKRWISREFINAVYSYAFEFAKLRRMNMVIAVENTAAIKMHEDLGHVREGYLRDWFDDGKDAVLYSYTRKDYYASRWFKWRLEREKNNELQAVEG